MATEITHSPSWNLYLVGTIVLPNPNASGFLYNGNTQAIGITFSNTISIPGLTITPFDGPPWPILASPYNVFNNVFGTTVGFWRNVVTYKIDGDLVPGTTDFDTDILILGSAELDFTNFAGPTIPYTFFPLGATGQDKIAAFTFDSLSSPAGTLYNSGVVGQDRTLTFLKDSITPNIPYIFDGSVSVIGGNPSALFRIYFGFKDAPRPQDASSVIKNSGYVGATSTQNIDLDYRGNADADISITPIPGSGAIYNYPAGHTGPSDYPLTVFGNTAGYYVTSGYILGATSVSGNNTGYVHTIIMNPGTLNIGSTGTQYFSALPPNISEITGITFTGMTGISYNPSTGQVEMPDSGKLGKVPGTYTVNWSADTDVGIITGSFPITLTSPPAPGVNTFVGGKYSVNICVGPKGPKGPSGQRGNKVNILTTGNSTDKLSLTLDLAKAIEKLIQLQGYPDYIIPDISLQNVNDLFYNDAFPDDVANTKAATLNFFLNNGTITGTQATVISKILDTYFTQVRTFIMKFYGYTPGLACSSGGTPGYASCVYDCNTSLTLMFCEI
jgi:hypothetical protein